MEMQSTLIPLNLIDQDYLVTLVKGHLGEIFRRTFSQKVLGLIAVLTNSLASLPYVLNISVR